MISQESAAAAAQFNDNLDKLKGAAQGLANQIFANLAPSMVAVTEEVVTFVKKAGGIPALADKVSVALFKIAAGMIAVKTTTEIAVLGLGTIGQALFQVAIRGVIFGFGKIQTIIAEGNKKMVEAAARGEAAIGKLVDGLTKLNVTVGETTGSTKKFNVELKKTTDKFETLPPFALFTEADQRVLDMTENWKKLNAEQAKLQAAWEALPPITFLTECDRQLVKLIDDMEVAQKQTASMESAATQMGNSFLGAFDSAITGAEGFKGILRGLLIDILRLIERMIFMATIGKLLTNLFTSFIPGFSGGGTVTAAGAAGATAGGGGMHRFAHGGRTPINSPIIVGERGKEIFFPDSAGRIVPNNQLGGTTIIIHAEGADAAVEARVRRAIQEAIKQSVALSQINLIDRAQRSS